MGNSIKKRSPRKFSKKRVSCVRSDNGHTSGDQGSLRGTAATSLTGGEVTVLATQAQIDVLATRIELAFRRGRPEWNSHCSTSRVWAAAASTWSKRQRPITRCLSTLNCTSVATPDVLHSDPWLEITGPEAKARYTNRSRRSFSDSNEMISEIALVKRRARGGAGVASALKSLREAGLAPGEVHRRSPLRP